jgi:hypothetical protein
VEKFIRPFPYIKNKKTKINKSNKALFMTFTIPVTQNYPPCAGKL